MPRSKKKLVAKNTFVDDVLICRYCCKVYHTQAKTEKLSKGLNVAKLKRHHKVCEKKKNGAEPIPYELVKLLLNKHLTIVKRQKSMNCEFKEIANYEYDISKLVESKDYSSR